MSEKDVTSNRETSAAGGEPPHAKHPVWPHVALAEGRLYVKDRAGNMKCYALAR